jgi:hypothetical protein
VATFLRLAREFAELKQRLAAIEALPKATKAAAR